MDPFTLALLGGSALASGGLNYMGSRQAAGAQSAAAQQAGLLGLIAQQQAADQARQAAAKGAAATAEYYDKGIGDVRAFYDKGRQDLQNYYGRGESALTDYYSKARADLLDQAQQGENIGREFYGKGAAAQEPYTTAGAGAINRLYGLFGEGGEYTTVPDVSSGAFMDPGYAFRRQQGEQTMLNAARAGGLAGSGGALKAATRYGQEAGSQEYQNAYARFMANRAQVVQGLQNIAGTGANAASIVSQLAGSIGNQLAGNRFTTGANLGQAALTTGGNIAQGAFSTGANLGQAATTTGANLGNMASNAGGAISGAYTGSIPTMAALTSGNPYGQAMENVGQARASGYVGGASALGQALQGPANAMLAYNMMDRFAPQTRSSIYAPQQAGYLSGGPTYAPGYSPGFMGVPTFGAPRVG